MNKHVNVYVKENAMHVRPNPMIPSPLYTAMANA